MISEHPGCLQCGETMRNTYGWKEGEGRFILGRGYLGHGVFCTLTCGYRFALAVVREAAK